MLVYFARRKIGLVGNGGGQKDLNYGMTGNCLRCTIKVFVMTGKPFLVLIQVFWQNINLSQGPFTLKALLKVYTTLKDLWVFDCLKARHICHLCVYNIKSVLRANLPNINS